MAGPAWCDHRLGDIGDRQGSHRSSVPTARVLQNTADVAPVDSHHKIIVVGFFFSVCHLEIIFFLANLFSSPPPPKRKGNLLKAAAEIAETFPS